MPTSKRLARQRALTSLKSQRERQMTWLKRAVAVAVIALAAGLL